MKDNVFEDAPLDAISAFTKVNATGLVRPSLAASTAGQPAMSLGAPALGWGVSAPVAPANQVPAKGLYRRAGKRLADIALVVMTLPMTLPIIVICAIALWLESGQPFYRQKRLGEAGGLFSIWKLRTMCRNADQMLETYLDADPALRREWDTTQKLKNDPRITPVGAFLRKTSLDELPQLINVLTGEMSIVGPRPMLPEQLPMYTDPAPYFDLRPGITGQWQVSDRNENSFSHRSVVDADYHAKLSLPVDLKILFQTVGVVLRRTGY
ncbi:MAG: sugar transferase [Roseovarius sp.]